MDNSLEGTFEDALDEFLSREEVLSASCRQRLQGRPSFSIRTSSSNGGGSSRVPRPELQDRRQADIEVRGWDIGPRGISYFRFYKCAGRISVLADVVYDEKADCNRIKELDVDFLLDINSVCNPRRRGFECGRFRGFSVRAKYILRIFEVRREKYGRRRSDTHKWCMEGTFLNLRRISGNMFRARAPERVVELIRRIMRCHNISNRIAVALFWN